MQDADLFAFMAIFRELLRVFPKRLDGGDVESLSKAYFTTLRKFTIAELQAGADAWMQRGKFFPKPSEWREAIPRRAATEARALMPLAPAEAAEYLDAERKRYEGDPCNCRRCHGAGVEHRLLRYVPEQDEQGRDMRGLIGERVVVRGRWLHGDDLRRWYDARDAFMAAMQAVIADKRMPDPVRLDLESNPYQAIG